jgi:4'-phosphopantetheinyl transferase
MKKRNYNSIDKSISLPKNEVHIWNFDLKKYFHFIDNFSNILSEEELIRAGKFYFERDKNWFIISRGLLKVFVNIYSSIPAKEIKFILNDFGKPSLQKADNFYELHFNLSHSKNFMNIGFVNDTHIGIDVELIKPFKDHLEIAKRFFSPAEVEQLLSFPPDKILDGFYSCWTAKESVIKLSGEGLSFPLKEFDVQLVNLNVGESYNYNVELKKRLKVLLLEVFKLKDDLYGACAVSNGMFDFIHCYLEDEKEIENLLH